MKKLFIFLLTLGLPLVVFAEGEANRAEWRFTKSKNFKPSKAYQETGIFPNIEGIKGSGISFYHDGKMVKASLNEKGYPTAKSTQGDYWLIEVPVEKLDKGTVVDLFLPYTGTAGSRNSFVLEYRDGKKWVEATTTLSTTSHKHPIRLWKSVRLTRPIKKAGTIALRLRQTDKNEVDFSIAGLSPRGQRPQVIIYDNRVPQDTLRMLFIGNSYTYYHTYPAIFKEIAWHEGHYADCNIFISGGYTMKAHLANPHSMEQVDKGGYDYVMLQDQSILPTLNGTADDAGSAEYMTKMVNRVRESSPEAKVLLEITWGRKFGSNNFGKYEQYIEKYPHFYSSYDAMQQRLIDVMTAEAEQNSALLNPVGLAWQFVMHERPDINLYHTDNHHQSYAGSYLAAAVAYLTIYQQPFGNAPANGKLSPEIASYLRSVAERVVLKGEKWSENKNR
ncbi:MAG: hypothetical protein E7143_03910 [Rikenellaceae bacterium]|nr:hypothetical protein [Rikenellaceae bacterium]